MPALKVLLAGQDELTEQEVARKTGINRTVLSLIKTGEREANEAQAVRLGIHFKVNPRVFNLRVTREQVATWLESLAEQARPVMRPVRAIDTPGDLRRCRMIPIVGRVAAGVPVLAEEHIEGELPVPSKDLTKGRVYFTCRVTGDSMEGAEIHDGDYALVLHEEPANPGDVVVATTGDGETTVKRLERRDGGTLWLIANTAPGSTRTYADIPVDEYTRFHGVVVGAIRYKPIQRSSRKK